MANFLFNTEILEPELLQELKQIPVIDVPKSMMVSMPGMEINAVPIGVAGKLRIYSKDELGRESTIYTIERGESCVVSVAASITHAKSNIWGIAETDSKVMLVPADKSNEWFTKYQSWRNFVISMYSERIKELIEQHTIATAQKDHIEHQNKQIVESINYAQNIQKAVLPSENQMKEFLSEHFIYYKPKAIVSGDFYWTKKENNRIFFAAADSTGHGVPGAMMSMLGISVLNEISHEFVGNAADFLNKMKTKIKDAMRQSEYDKSPKDGFDIALCVFYPDNGILEYAGANSPLILVRNNELIEIKHDKMPVGVHLIEKESFTNHQIKIENNDMIYMFSDGYRDQFGGENNQKYSFKKFKEKLLTISNLELDLQKNELDNEFSNWKGNKEQIDDILILGIKMKQKS